MAITIAQVISVFGIKGELKVYLHTDFSAIRFKKGNTISLKKETDGVATEMIVRDFREDFPVGYLSIESITTRTEAETWIGAWISIDDQQRKSLPKDTYYLPQLMDCTVEDEQGHPLGIVCEVITSTAQPILRIKKSGCNDVLLPFVSAWVEKVLITNKRIIVKRGEGMFE